jgi:hypothetical protein
MHRLLVTLVLIAGSALVAGAGASASTSPLAGEWHRLNSANAARTGPEHELLRCVQNAGTLDPWRCRYSKAPEPTLNFAWNNNYGVLTGRDITATWSCPSWFPAGVCSNVVGVIEGTMTFIDPDTNQTPFSVLEDLVVTQSAGGQVLYNYWVDQFVCPWFRSLDEALAANPIPLPFDGTFPQQDCVAAS